MASTKSSGTKPTTGTGTGSGKLAQEIQDEFLTCKICLEGFKSPKCLDCLHTFCEQCIDNHVKSECTYKKYSDYREFTCPLCRKRTQLPVGGVKKLPDNFLVSSLSEHVARQRPSKFPFCDICKLIHRKHLEASSKCLDCNKLLCSQCVDVHKQTKVTKDHSVFDVEIEKDVECKEHQEEAVRFYCEPCEACICVLCTFNEHKDHEVTSFGDAVLKYKETIQMLLECCKEKIETYDSQLGTLSKCDGQIKKAEQLIRDSAIQFIAEIRSKEKQLIEDLHQQYGTELMEYVNRRGEMQSNLDSLKSTCSLTEIVLKGKDIELLLLKRQVHEKLSCLSEITLKDLPASVQKNITFIPGSLDLGRLATERDDEPDSPFASKFKNRTSGFPNQSQEPTTQPRFFRTFYTQTDEAPGGGGGGDKPAMTNSTVQTDKDSAGSKPSINKATETEVVRTAEKAVNTRSRNLTSLTHQLQRNPDEQQQNDGTTIDPQTSPTPRRHRRRRERPKPVEVPAQPTANSSVSFVPSTGGHILTYSSSIEENYYSPDSGNGPGSPDGRN